MKTSKYSDALNELVKLAVSDHTYCEDSWYSCPLAADGCSDPSKPEGVCSCGASAHNAKVLKLAKVLTLATAAADCLVSNHVSEKE